MSWRDKVVESARSRHGQPYASMDCGLHGWGCAMHAAQAYNDVFYGGIKPTTWELPGFYGSCWNLYGSALGESGWGDYPLTLTDNPQAGDIVLYLSSSYGTATDASHAAIYLGDGKVSGANGSGAWPNNRGYVEETTVAAQSYGRDWVYATWTGGDPTEPVIPPVGRKGIGNKSYTWYSAHGEDYGWQGWVHGGQVAGTTGYSKRLEALKLRLPVGVNATVTAHIQDLGDKTYKLVGGKIKTIGTTGQALRMEGISIDVTKNDGVRTKGKTLMYRVHMADKGWGKWRKAGAFAGTRGESRQVEAIQLRWA